MQNVKFSKKDNLGAWFGSYIPLMLEVVCRRSQGASVSDIAAVLRQRTTIPVSDSEVSVFVEKLRTNGFLEIRAVDGTKSGKPTKIRYYRPTYMCGMLLAVTPGIQVLHVP